MAYVTCHMYCVTCHMSLTSTAPTAKDPPPANSPTMHSRLVLQDKTKNPKKVKTQNFFKTLKNCFLVLQI